MGYGVTKKQFINYIMIYALAILKILAFSCEKEENLNFNSASKTIRISSFCKEMLSLLLNCFLHLSV